MDRLTRVHIRNVRAIEYAVLDLTRPLTVLIGENGSGKSTILECLELLRKAAEPSFMQQFYTVHRGMPALLRKGAPFLELGVEIEDDEGLLPPLDYRFTLESQGPRAVVRSECLVVGSDPRGEGSFSRATSDTGRLDRDQLWLAGGVPPRPEVHRMVRALKGIEVHLPFDNRASWGARTYQRPESLRVASTLFPADRLSLLGFNLANAWAELRGRGTADWDHTLALVRLGLGDRVDSVTITPDAGGGNVYLALRFVDLPEPVLAADLSDGQLSWLAFVAMARLNPSRSLLAMDEPELHLHPHLLAAVVALLARLDVPVVLATHADRVLELLDDPAGAVRVCALDEAGATVARLDAAALAPWLEHYGDLGRLRAAGYLSRVLLPPPEPSQTPP